MKRIPNLNASAATQPSEPAARAAAAGANTHLETLPSGLRLVTHTSRAAPVVAFQIWCGTGAFDENDDERGLAHLHEHMLFKGTPTRGVGEIAGQIEACGGQINAWTSSDQTCYHVVLPAHEWRNGLEVLADAYCHSLFDGDELGREIEVVVEEIKRANDSPSRVAYRRLFELVFCDHPYSLPVLGTSESVRGMTSERMRAFYGKHYVAANTTVVAAGDIDVDAVRAAVAEFFADLPSAPAIAKPTPAVPRPSANAAVLKTAFSESRAIVAFPAPPLLDKDVPALDVLALVLGQGDSSRLVREIKDRLELVNDIGAWSYTPWRAGAFAASLLTSADRLADALAAVVAEFERVRREGISDVELEKARTILLAEATYKLETVQGLAHSLGYFSVVCDDPLWEQTYHARVAALTKDDVLRVARRILDPAKVQVVQLLGEDADAGADGASLLDEAGLVELARRGMAGSSAQTATKRSRDLIDGIELIELASGDQLVVLPDNSVPMVSLRVAALGGLRDETPASNGASHMLGELLVRGTGQRDADTIALGVDRIAADLGGFSGRNSLGMYAVTLSQHREALLGLLFDSLFDSRLPEAELERQRSAQLEDIRHQVDSPARTCFRHLLSALYGEHPYAWDMLGSIDSVRGLQRDDLISYMRGRLAPGRLVWSAAGDVDADALARAIEAATPSDRVPLAEPQPPTARRLDAPIERRVASDKEQAHIAIGFAGTRIGETDRHALQVMSTILSGQGGRLFLELRDRQSLAYSVTSMSVEGVDPGHIAFYIGTSPDKVDRARAGLYDQIARLVQDPVAAVELDRARRYLAGAHAIGLQRSGARAAAIGFSELYGLGRAAWKGHLAALLAVSAEDILAAAQRYLEVGHHVEVVLAPNE